MPHRTESARRSGCEDAHPDTQTGRADIDEQLDDRVNTRAAHARDRADRNAFSHHAENLPALIARELIHSSKIHRHAAIVKYLAQFNALRSVDD